MGFCIFLLLSRGCHMILSAAALAAHSSYNFGLSQPSMLCWTVQLGSYAQLCAYLGANECMRTQLRVACDTITKTVKLVPPTWQQYVCFQRAACCRPLQIVCVSICGWAYAFMITIQPVRKDYEVLYDYGYSYCK